MRAKVMLKGMARFNEVYGKFARAVREGNFEGAIELGTSALRLKPHDRRTRMRLAGVLRRMGRHAEAQGLLHSGIDEPTRAHIADVVPRIAERLGGSAGYQLMVGGVSSAIVLSHQGHHCSCSIAVTKVLKAAEDATKKELAFYRQLRPRSPGLKACTPDVMDLCHSRDGSLVFLTLTATTGRRVLMTRDPGVVIRAWSRIASSWIDQSADTLRSLRRQRAGDLVRRLRWQIAGNGALPIREVLESAGRPGFAARYLAVMMRVARMRQLETHEAGRIRMIGSLLKRTWLPHFISPQRDFGIVHGDFQPMNMGYTSPGESIAVFDWASYYYGLSVLDLVQAVHLMDTSTLVEQVLPLIRQHSNNHTAIQEAVFLLARAMYWYGNQSLDVIEGDSGRLSDEVCASLRELVR